MNIIHLSDTHFGSDALVYYESELSEGIAAVAEQIHDSELILLITGDITFQGAERGYDIAKQFFSELCKSARISRENILLCPGNHDIVPDQWFRPFDGFSYSLRRDNRFTYSGQNCVTFERPDVTLIGINSAFKLDYKYGMVDVASVEKALGALPDKHDTPRAAFLHHHLINQFESDISVLRNAYDLLKLLDRYRFDYIFHGHQHGNQTLAIGESRMNVFGVRTLNFETKGYSNGFNVYRFSDDGLVVDNQIYSRDFVGGVKCVDTVTITREVR